MLAFGEKYDGAFLWPLSQVPGSVARGASSERASKPVAPKQTILRVFTYGRSLSFFFFFFSRSWQAALFPPPPLCARKQSYSGHGGIKAPIQRRGRTGHECCSERTRRKSTLRRKSGWSPSPRLAPIRTSKKVYPVRTQRGTTVTYQ